MPDQTLMILLDEVRRKTLALLEGVSDEEARWAPPGLYNTILWHAGHSYILLEWLSMQAVGGQPTCPDGWFELFSWASRPETVPAERWPPLAEVAYQLRLQHGRIRKLVAGLSDEQLASSALGRPDRIARWCIVHALHDEACHNGEIWLLRKMQRAD